MDEVKTKTGTTIAISLETHELLEELKLELKTKKFDQVINKLAKEYKEQRK
jgi:hypothetical protein